ncbi:glycosyltransferase family 2 protein [Aequorivita sediminis]|uniref:glycosyltransferase family 2 protein n=1 Tax=Aequorivita sediminis TaxID=3073653 RepID=UPI0028A853E7|nr:glycosyltransferase [Aequorivita sp. F6058]
MKESKQFLVSIIVPVYNTETYLRDCLNSIINQSYSNIEIILINDGSTDASGKICDEYAVRDDRVVVFHQQNSGPSVARNLGLDKAKGKYFAFIDSDDLYHYQFIEILMSGFRDSSIEVSFCNFTREAFDYKDVPWKTMDFEHFYLNFEDFLTKVVPWNKVYKREVWDNVRFIPHTLHEDMYVYFKLFYNRKLAFTENKLYYYRRDREGNRTSDNKSEENLLAKLEAFTLEKKFFLEKNEAAYVRKVEKSILYYRINLFNNYNNAQAQKALKMQMIDIVRAKFLNWKEKLSLLIRIYKV